MKRANFAITIVTIMCQQAISDFDCQENKDFSAGSCQRELQCIYEEAYEEREDYSKYCRCKTLISDLPLPNNALKYNKFRKICSLHKSRLQQLWVIDAQLELIENDIFANYPNLRYLNLAGNRLRLNFSTLAENITELDVSNNGLNLIQEDAFDSLKSLKMINVSFNRLDRVNSCFKKLTALEEVYLNNNNLLAILSEEFDHLENLRVLDLAYNLLTSVEAKLSLRNLHELYLNNNQLTRIKGNDLPNLRILRINDNLISNLSGIYGYANLEEFYLENNNITTVEEDFLRELPNLKLLNMSNNKIDFISKRIPKGNSLRIVDVSSNRLNYIAWYKFQNLSSLNLDRNDLDKESFNCGYIESVEKLDELYLSHNKIGEIESCTFNKLKNLSKLSLKATGLTRIPPGAFEGLSKLREVNLAENQIEEIPQSLFNDLLELRILNVSHNNLSIFDLNVLGNNPKITNFDVKNNPLRDLDLGLLKNKLPKLKLVDFDSNLVKCDMYGDVVRYFEQNNVIFKSCPSAGDCCKNNGISEKFIFSGVVIVAICLFAIIGLIFLCKICKSNVGQNHAVHLRTMRTYNY